MYYYHMTSLNVLHSIVEKGLLPKNESNSKLIGDEKVKVFFSEGVEGAVALYVDFDIVFDKIKNGQIKLADKCIEKKVLEAKSLADYLGEGVYLRFDGAGIENERNFENGCTDRTIPPNELSVCILRKRDSNSIHFSRFEIIKYMMAQIQPEQIKYYGASYDGAPNFDEATKRIQEKVGRYYEKHRSEIDEYADSGYELDTLGLNDFVEKFLSY